MILHQHRCIQTPQPEYDGLSVTHPPIFMKKIFTAQQLGCLFLFAYSCLANAENYSFVLKCGIQIKAPTDFSFYFVGNTNGGEVIFVHDRYYKGGENIPLKLDVENNTHLEYSAHDFKVGFSPVGDSFYALEKNTLTLTEKWKGKKDKEFTTSTYVCIHDKDDERTLKEAMILKNMYRTDIYKHK
jgi:hypothetical protein